MRIENEWKSYKAGMDIDTDDEALKKYVVKLEDGREIVACYSFVCFIDIDRGVVIDEKVVAYRELDDELS